MPQIISVIYVLETKLDTMVLFPVFCSSTDKRFLHTNTKHFTLSAICSSAFIPPILHVLPLALYHILRNIHNCCSDPYFQFIQNIHSLYIHLVFHTDLNIKVQSMSSGERGGRQIRSPLPTLHRPGKVTFTENVRKMSRYTFQLRKKLLIRCVAA
jgi:hypothetical protein